MLPQPSMYTLDYNGGDVGGQGIKTRPPNELQKRCESLSSETNVQRLHALGRVVAMSYMCSVRIAPGSRAIRKLGRPKPTCRTDQVQLA